MPSSAQPPYRAYAVIFSAFLGGLALAGGLARVLGREPIEQRPLDLAVLSLATFKAARTLARDDVASFIRQPFVAGDAGSGVEERPLPDGGMKQAVGELVTCSRCVGAWVAAILGAGQLLAPRFGRLVTWILAAGALNDWLQAGFAALAAKSNELESTASSPE